MNVLFHLIDNLINLTFTHLQEQIPQTEQRFGILAQPAEHLGNL